MRRYDESKGYPQSPLDSFPLFGDRQYHSVFTSQASELRDGSIGTHVFLYSGDYDVNVDFDRFGHIVEDRVGLNLYQDSGYGDVLYPDGSEYHYYNSLGGAGGEKGELTIGADGTRTEKVTYSGADGLLNPDVDITVTPGRTLLSSSKSNTEAGSVTKSIFDSGEKFVDQVDNASGNRRHLEYDAKGKGVVEQRYDAGGQLTYETKGALDAAHTSLTVRNGVSTLTTWSDGKTIASIDTMQANHTHTIIAKVAGVVHGGETGNDVFTGFKGGSDTFVFGSTFGNDKIRNFEASKDTVKLLDPTVFLDDLTLGYSASGADTIVHVGDEGTITLLNAHINSVSDLHILSTNRDFLLNV